MKHDLLRRRGTFKVLVSMALAMLILGCASGTKTVLVPIPPRIDLRGFDAIGMVDFAPESEDKLGHAATQQFMSAIHAAQPGVRFLELGSQERLLGQARRDRIDPETIRVFGKQHNVDSVFTGTYEVSESLPQVSVDKDLTSMRASARAKMSLTVRQWDTKTGATIWTKTRQGEWPVSKMRVEAGRSVGVRMNDSREQYDDFMLQLVRAITSDFAVQYERRPVATAPH